MVPERLVPGTPEWELYSVEHRQRYEFFAHRCQGLSVLDAACGVGYGSRILAQAGARSVLGVDISSEATNYAQANFADPNVQFITEDVAHVSRLEKTFDVVVSFETLEHLRNPERFIAEVRRILHPEGLFVCSTPNKDFNGKGGETNPHHLSELTFEEFQRLFAGYFYVEGQYHQSHSPSHLRHLELLRELSRIEKQVRFSKLMRLEQSLRSLLGKFQWDSRSLPASLWRAVPGDYVIEPLEKPLRSQLTFILVGRPNARITSRLYS